jgi:hypothetical protein
MLRNSCVSTFNQEAKVTFILALITTTFATPTFHEAAGIERDGSSILAHIVIPATSASPPTCQSFGYWKGTQAEMATVSAAWSFSGGDWDTSYTSLVIGSSTSFVEGGVTKWKRHVGACIDYGAEAMTCPAHSDTSAWTLMVDVVLETL